MHLMVPSLNAIQDCGTAVAFICGAYTSKLQVLDIGVNKPFKGLVRDTYEDWMVTHPHGTKVKRQDVWFSEFRQLGMSGLHNCHIVVSTTKSPYSEYILIESTIAIKTN